jgi:hypothetical protein
LGFDFTDGDPPWRTFLLPWSDFLRRLTAHPNEDTAKAQTGVSPQRRKGRQGEQPGEEMELKFVGLQSRSEFAGRLLIGLPIFAFLVRRRIDRVGWGLLSNRQ